MAGKLITILQLILSAGLLILVWNSGMVPGLYLALLGGGLLLLFAVTFCLQYVKSKVKFAGMVISILISIGLAVGIVYFLRIQQTMADVGGATYKTDNMIVVVKASDPAESILDAANYRFGYQTSVDQENNDKMLDDVQTVAGRELKLSEYDTVTDLANGLRPVRSRQPSTTRLLTASSRRVLKTIKIRVKILYQYGYRDGDSAGRHQCGSAV